MFAHVGLRPWPSGAVWRAALPAALGGALTFVALEARAAAYEVVAPQGPVARGDVLLVALKQLPANARVEGSWRGVPLEFAADGPAERLALVGVDLRARPGRYPLTIRITRPGAAPERWRRTIEVVDKDYGVQRLKLPRWMDRLDGPTLARVRREAALLSVLWPRRTPERYWQGSFMAPLPGKVSTPFGVGRIINGEPRSPHSGVDLRASLGEPVRATNRGRVAFVGDLFFHGLAVVVDHGLGLYSMYFHLCELRVAPGDLVEKGGVIGLAGSTGRSTGPHLHWGVRLAGARVDPFSLVRATTEAFSAGTR